eukprot:2798332-Amphidinium_carterae.1
MKMKKTKKKKNTKNKKKTKKKLITQKVAIDTSTSICLVAKDICLAPSKRNPNSPLEIPPGSRIPSKFLPHFGEP